MAGGGALWDAPLPVAARFEPASLTSSQLVGLAVGDVITLPHPAGWPLRLYAGGRPYLSALPGRRGGRMAVEIAEPIPGATP
jgi:flagellar motor switch protein FliM